MRDAVGVPPPTEPSPPSSARPDLFIVEAGEPRDRTCAECGKRMARWKPGRRRGAAVILCEDCAAKPAAGAGREATCPSCGVALRPGDGFCGKCGLRLEHVCAACGNAMGPEGLFCAKGGARVAGG